MSELIKYCILMCEILFPVDCEDPAYTFECWYTPSGSEDHIDGDRWGVCISVDGSVVSKVIEMETLERSVRELHESIRQTCEDTANELLRLASNKTGDL
jgi:hypothetical protein